MGCQIHSLEEVQCDEYMLSRERTRLGDLNSFHGELLTSTITICTRHRDNTSRDILFLSRCRRMQDRRGKGSTHVPPPPASPYLPHNFNGQEVIFGT